MGLCALLWLFTSADSPVPPLLCRVAVRRALTGTPVTAFDVRRIGLGLWPGHFRLGGVSCRAGALGTVTLARMDTRFRLLPLLGGTLSLRSVEVDGLSIELDATQPVPPLPAGGDTPPPALRPDLARLPVILVTNVSLHVTISTSTSPPPSVVTITNLALDVTPDPGPDAALPMLVRLTARCSVDGGDAATIHATGAVGIDGPAPEGINADVDFALKGLPLADLNNLLREAAPFLVDSGGLDGYFNACCREGRLSGLASFTTHRAEIRPNEGGGSKFLELSFKAWQFLVRQRDGVVSADCPISGTLVEPVVPFGPVLREQAAASGRNLGVRLLDKIPLGISKDAAATWEEKAAEKDKHDDILKISRLESVETHYQRGRHYEKQVKNYRTAVREYEAQVTAHPGETDLAVQSLRAMAALQHKHLDDPAGAMQALRRVVDDYRKHRDADDAMATLIDLAEETRDYPQADRLCREFLEIFPHSALVEDIRKQHRAIRKFVW